MNSKENLTRYVRHAFLAITTVLALPLAAEAQSLTWTGAVDSDWFNANNWDDGALGNGVPDADTAVTVGGGTNYPITINSVTGAEADSIQRTSASSSSSLTVETNLTVDNDMRLAQNGSGEFVVGASAVVGIGGALTVQNGGSGTGSFLQLADGATFSAGGVATASNSSGNAFVDFGNNTVTLNDFLQIDSRAPGNSGFGLNMTEGTVNINNDGSAGGASNPNGMGVGYNDFGQVSHSGGTININNGGNLEIGSRNNGGSSGNGTFYFSDDAVLNVDGNVVIGSNSSSSSPVTGIGNFVVSGNGTGSINVGGWDQRADTIGTSNEGLGILTLEVSTDGLFTIDVDGDVFFGLGAQIDVVEIDGYMAMIDDEFTVMDYTGSLTDDGLLLSTGWEYSIVDNGAFDSLVITYVGVVPEPTSAALVAGGLGLLLLRRRQRG